MRRNRIWALILTMSLLLTACGGKETAQSPETITVPTTATNAPAEEKTATLGKVEGNTYTNTYAGIGFSLDENWVVYPADQLQDLSAIVEGAFEGTDLEGMEYTNIMDFLAENVNDLTTMNLNYSKLSMQERLTYAMKSDEAVIDDMLDNYYDTLVATYENAGIIVERIEKKDVTFLNQSCVAMHTTATMNDVPYYVLQIYNYGLGAYGVTLTLASYIEDNTESLLNLFYTVE